MTDLDRSRRLDQEDGLRSYHDAFVKADPDQIYLLGNSLGRLPKRTAERLKEVVAHGWGQRLIEGWTDGWWEAPRTVGDKIGRLVGAGPGQIVVNESTTVNLYKAAMAALTLSPGRSRIVVDDLNFPTDLYVLQGCARLEGEKRHLHTVSSRDGAILHTEDLAAAITEDTALVVLSHVLFRSGAIVDMEAVTRHAHEQGARVLWDLSHSAGVVPVDLDGLSVDFAVGCGYKYLNGGPGAPSFLYVRKDLQEQALSPIWGWFGQENPFAMETEYTPVSGISRFLAGSPSILQILALDEGVTILLDAGLGAIREKSKALTSTLISLSDEILAPLGFDLATPRDPEERGSHVALSHAEAFRISLALRKEMNMLLDFREPGILRLGLAPLYTAFEDVWGAVDRLRMVVEEERFKAYDHARTPVT